MSQAIQTVREFMAGIDRVFSATGEARQVEAGKLLEMIDDDIHYQLRPLAPADGKQRFLEWMGEYAACETMTCEILRIADAGDAVLAELHDTWTMQGATMDVLASMTFEVRDGRITSWVEYFPEIEEWKASGQMPAGFFERWRSEEAAVV